MNRHQFEFVARKFRAGKISLKDFCDQVFETSPADHSPQSESGGNECVLPRIPQRSRESHKGDYGRLLIVAGSAGMAGAAAMSAQAALRAGAGLVTVATAKTCQQLVAGFHPSVMTVGLPDDGDGRISIDSLDHLMELVPKSDCIAIGPGLGQSSALASLLKDLFANDRLPCVIDADGLNNLGSEIRELVTSAPRLLTPHPGELQRLTKSTIKDREMLEKAAIQLAKQTKSIIVLKGYRTLITDGIKSHHNRTGNPGMATAGSGDVLTGIIAALVCVGLTQWDAGVLGCHLHGLAGDLVASRHNETSLIATDLIDAIPDAITACQPS